MTQNLHPQHLQDARSAILDRFYILNTPPGGTATFHMFQDEQIQYRGGYFAKAFDLLLAEKHVELLNEGLFIRLTDSGYEEARK